MFKSKKNYIEIEDSLGQKSKSNLLRNVILVVTTIGFVGLIGVVALLQNSGENENEKTLLTKSNVETINYQTNTTQVQLKYGTLEGIVLQSRRGRNFSAFYNIPYAKPAVGELRFEPPEEFTEHWKGVRDATTPGEACIQPPFSSSWSEVSGQEDCQYLTIYTPKFSRRSTHASPGLPVMVYFLGGAFVHGHASIYGGEYFMDQDVIIVLPETRWGVFGFLSTGDSVVPGNMGFKDQTMVLRWVQANIEKFGGDPKKVTIFGNSSGSMSVHLHMMSNSSAGLFHRAISQSGVLILPKIEKPNPLKTVKKLGKKVGCPTKPTQELVDCLKTVDVLKLLEAAGQLFMPGSLEPIGTENAFLTDSALNIMQKGTQHSKNIPWILGVNSDELSIVGIPLASLNPSALKLINANIDKVISGITSLPNDSNLSNSTSRIKELYFGDKPVSNQTHQNFTNLIDDRYVVHPTYLTGELQNDFNHQNNIFLYVLTKRPIKSLGSDLESLYDPPYGVTHADEVQYFFPYDKFPYIGLDSVDLQMSEELVKMWVNFAKSANPHQNWRPINNSMTDQDKWFQLDNDFKMTDFAQERMKLWNTFPVNDLYT